MLQGRILVLKTPNPGSQSKATLTKPKLDSRGTVADSESWCRTVSDDGERSGKMAN